MKRDVKKLGAVRTPCDGLSLRNYFLYGEPPFDVNKVKEWVK